MSKPPRTSSRRSKTGAAATAPSDPDAPRRLSEEEINVSVAKVPYPHAITAEHSAFAREQIMQIVRADLMAIELCPSGLDDLVMKIITQFEESRVKPGSMVGFAAAEAPSARFTQDNLSAVHKAGQAGMQGTGGAVGRIADLVSKQQSKAASDYDACTVFFHDIQTEHSIIHDKRPDMVAINVSVLLRTDEPSIIEYNNVLFPDGNLPAWYHIYSHLYGVPVPNLKERDNGKLLRLYLDIEKVVEYRVMVSEMRRALMSSNSRVLRYFISPMHIGIIDVWALDEEFHSYGLDISGNIELDVFNCLHGFADSLNKYLIKGIPGIRDVQAAKFDIWPIMTLGQSHRHLHDHVYEYRLSSIWPMRFGWERARLLWKHLHIVVESYDDKSNSWVVLDGVKEAPHDIIRKAISEDETASTQYQKDAVASGKSVITRPVTPANTMYWSQLWYAKTEGTNLREIAVRDDVDARYTISNRPFEVLEIYGIVAARRVMLEELYLSFGGGRDEPNFSVRHFSVLADFVCHTGVIRPISNLMIQGRSTLSKATFARQFNTLVSPAIHGIDEPIGDVSAAIMVASRAPIGPRAFEYEGLISKGVTAEEIKASLRSGSQSIGEMDKLIASLTDSTDVPLYITGGEGKRSMKEASMLMGGYDDDAEADAEFIKEYEASAAALPPGVTGDDDDEIPAHTGRDEDLIIDDEEGDDMVVFNRGQARVEEEEEVKPVPRRRTAASRRSEAKSRTLGAPVGGVMMSPALTEVIKSAGGTVVPSDEKEPPPPACPIRQPKKSSLRKDQVPKRSMGISQALTFVDDE